MRGALLALGMGVTHCETPCFRGSFIDEEYVTVANDRTTQENGSHACVLW